LYYGNAILYIINININKIKLSLLGIDNYHQVPVTQPWPLSSLASLYNRIQTSIHNDFNEGKSISRAAGRGGPENQYFFEL
jgi:hypothetical protein